MKDNLLKMNTELLFNLMELLDMLSYRPSQWPAQAEAVGRLMRQMHYLLNVMRRHQVGVPCQHVHKLPGHEHKAGPLVVASTDKGSEAAHMCAPPAEWLGTALGGCCIAGPARVVGGKMQHRQRLWGV